MELKVYESPELVELGDAEVLVQSGVGNRAEAVGHWQWDEP
jgi:hypothetical protein